MFGRCHYGVSPKMPACIKNTLAVGSYKNLFYQAGCSRTLIYMLNHGLIIDESEGFSGESCRMISGWYYNNGRHNFFYDNINGFLKIKTPGYVDETVTSPEFRISVRHPKRCSYCAGIPIF